MFIVERVRFLPPSLPQNVHKKMYGKKKNPES